jgi:hypothetical protein
MDRIFHSHAKRLFHREHMDICHVCIAAEKEPTFSAVEGFSPLVSSSRSALISWFTQ